MMIHNRIWTRYFTRLCIIITSSENHNFVKIRANHGKKKSSKFTKKITHLDVVQDIVQDISHRRSRVWIKYCIRLCIIISSRCMIFFINLDDFFTLICMNFYEIVVCTE